MAIPEITVESKGVTMESFSPDGKKLWSITAGSAVGDVGPGADSAELRNVQAYLFDEGREGLRLRANEGTADEASGKLVLRGKVVAATEDGQTSITCDKIVWERDNRVLIATGNVNGTTAGLTLGPADEARATFKSKKTSMNKTAAAALILTSLVIQGRPITYRDKAGNMNMQARSLTMKFDEAANVYTFVGTGPFIARWVKQKITISGNRLTGVIAPVGPRENQSFELREGVFTGNIEARLDDAGKRGRLTITGLSRFALKSSADGKLWDIDGDGAPFKADLPDSGVVVTGRSFEAKANRTRLSGTETPEWRSAKFTGGVRAILKQTDKKANKPFTLDATCPTITIDRATLSMTLSGGVVINGDHPALGPGGAEITAPKIVLEFDKEMRVLKNVTMEGG